MYAQNRSLSFQGALIWTSLLVLGLTLANGLVWFFAFVEVASADARSGALAFQIRHSNEPLVVLASIMTVLSLVALTRVLRSFHGTLRKLVGDQITRIDVLSQQLSHRFAVLKPRSPLAQTHQGPGAFEDLASAIQTLEMSHASLVKSEDLILSERVREQQSQRLEELIDVASGVAEQVNKPIGLIYSLAEEIQLEAQKAGLKKIVAAAEKIQDASAQITSSTRGFEGLVNEQGDEEYRLAPLHVLIEDSLKFFEEKIQSLKIRVDVAPGRTDLLIWCRPIQMSQVIQGLLLESISVVESSPSDRWIRLEVQELLDSVFFAVTSSCQSTTDSVAVPFHAHGGIGLNLARGILQSQGGSLSVEPKNGMTRLLVRIPSSRPGSSLKHEPVEFDK